MKKTLIIITAAIMLIASNALALDSFKIFRNYKGDQTFAIPQGYVNTYLLTASAAKTITIPTGSRYVIFASTADIWVRIGTGTAAIPAGDTNNGTGSELNPICRWIEGETQMSVISAYAAKVSITYYE
ncbi:MAG: hypothetical protein JRF53_00530 [Deltaproteobacteria bacterium]|nr:hypothetical protein [Deltaproteobacteria bacterium]